MHVCVRLSVMKQHTTQVLLHETSMVVWSAVQAITVENYRQGKHAGNLELAHCMCMHHTQYSIIIHVYKLYNYSGMHRKHTLELASSNCAVAQYLPLSFVEQE